MNDTDIMEADYDDMSDADVIVLSIVGNKPILKTRLQKISLLYNRIYSENKSETTHNAYFFGGFSDEIEESASNLVDIGIINETSKGYEISDYGIKLLNFLKNDKKEKIPDRIDCICKSLSEIPDRNVIGLTYHFYKDTAAKSTIANSVDRLNQNASYDGTPLNKMNQSDFECKLKKGIKIRMG